MKKLKFNPDNAKYYSEEFIKGFECGVERQFNADMEEKTTINSTKTTITDGDLISRDSAIELVNYALAENKDVLEVLENIPSAEKTAEWIKQKSGDELFPEEIVCSKCYHSNSHLDFDEHNNPIGKLFLESKYCPNCGAKMEESEENQ